MDEIYDENRQAVLTMYRSRFELAPGMRLARPIIVVEHGRVILRLPAGLELNALNLAQLAAAHVECVAVVAEIGFEGGEASEADQATSTECADCLVEHAARVERLFAHTDPHSELTQAFKAAVLTHRRTECSEQSPAMRFSAT